MNFYSILNNIFWFVTVISFIVFIHELGHFIVARMCGVYVEVFAIGFGKPIFSWKDKHQTSWQINYLPLGGYIKMFGDRESGSFEVFSLTDEEVSKAFYYKPIWQKALIVFAGPMANYILAFLLLTIVLYTQRPHTIMSVEANSIAALAKIEQGDTLIAVNDRKIEDISNLSEYIKNSDSVALSIKRGNNIKTYNIEIQKKSLGITISTKKISLANAMLINLRQIIHISKMILNSLMNIFVNKDIKDLGGPIKIASVSGSFANKGFIALISFMAMLSLNLGLFNLLPINPLDGGHLLNYLLEFIYGKKLPAFIYNIGMLFGFVILALLMITATWNDIIGFFKK